MILLALEQLGVVFPATGGQTRVRALDYSLRAQQHSPDTSTPPFLTSAIAQRSIRQIALSVAPAAIAYRLAARRTQPVEFPYIG